jgi:hypothetical protein
VLTPRLVAKMLTESYGETGYVAAGDPVGAGNPNTVGNPYSLFTDPEFLALNPGHYWPSVSTNPLIVSGNNDMIYELTRWLNSDKTTRDWLDGKPDQIPTPLSATPLSRSPDSTMSPVRWSRTSRRRPARPRTRPEPTPRTRNSYRETAPSSPSSTLPMRPLSTSRSPRSATRPARTSCRQLRA